MPDKIGSYFIEEELGRGAMGVVFRARHEYTQREVALKVLFDHVAASDVGVERFRREVSVSSRVEAPGIVEIFDAGPYGDSFYYAMEMLEGEELGEVTPDLSLPERVRLIADACESLGACHEAGIVHRDLKPENIFVVDEPNTLTKIFDFGISSMRDAPRATATGNVVGTPVFMSPEQATDAGEAQPPADVWSIGVILYELTSGRLPVDADSSTQILIKVADADINYLTDDDGPPGLIDVINTCLAAEPEQRFANATELHRSLRDVLTQTDWSNWGADESFDSIPKAFTQSPITPTHDGESAPAMAPTEGLSATLPQHGTPDDHEESSESEAPTTGTLTLALVLCALLAVSLLGGVLYFGRTPEASTAASEAMSAARQNTARAIDGASDEAKATFQSAEMNARSAASNRADAVQIAALRRPSMPDDAADTPRSARSDSNKAEKATSTDRNDRRHSDTAQTSAGPSPTNADESGDSSPSPVGTNGLRDGDRAPDEIAADDSAAPESTTPTPDAGQPPTRAAGAAAGAQTEGSSPGTRNPSATAPDTGGTQPPSQKTIADPADESSDAPADDPSASNPSKSATTQQDPKSDTDQNGPKNSNDSPDDSDQKENDDEQKPEFFTF